MKKITVAVVDDHKLFREGFCSLMQELPYISKVIQACDGQEFLQLLKSQAKIDVVFMDVTMPVMDGIEATRLAMEINSSIKVIALTMHVNQDVYNDMAKVGCHGYVLKSASFIEIQKALWDVLQGKTYQYKGAVTLNATKPVRAKNAITESMTQRELEVIKYIGRGFTSSRIADELQISKKTVDKHRENIFIKSNVSNAIDLVIVAIKNGIIEV